MRAEDDLLLLCARTSIDAERELRLRALLRGERIDWSYILQTARQHGVLPLVYRTLQTACPDAVPDGPLGQLRAFAHTTAVNNLLLTNDMHAVLRLLRDAGIPVLPYKGPVLAASVYGDISARQFCDVDLLVRERDFAKTTGQLIRGGYQLVLTRAWEATFVDRQWRVAVDLHQRISPKSLPCPLDFVHMWARRTAACVCGTTVFGLSPEDRIFTLSIQMVKDAWENRTSLAKICDIAECLEAYRDLDWRGLMSEATRLRLERVLLFSLCLAEVVLGSELPTAVGRRARALPAIHEHAARVRSRLFSHTRVRYPDLFARMRFHANMYERWRDKLAQRHILWTKLREWRTGEGTYRGPPALTASS